MFSNIFTLLRLIFILAKNRAFFFKREDLTPAKARRLAFSLQEMGPTFVKLGQVISTRSDLIGQEAANILGELQDRVPPFASRIAHKILEEQLGKPASELFAYFDDNVAASASIAQVHFAKLKNGDDVAVKILRPGIEKDFLRDVELFYWLSDIAEWLYPKLKRFRLQEIGETFEETVRFELDLRFEAGAAVELRQNLSGDSGFYVPKVYWEYTSQKVLTTERIYGIQISDVAAIKAAGHDTLKLVNQAAISFFKQVFRDGFFHADMHPGNMFVLANGDIAVVDFGIMGRIDYKSRIYLAKILHGFLTEDYYNLAKVHFEAGFVPPHKSVENFALALMALSKPILGRNLSEISVARLLGQLFSTAETFEMQAQPHLLLLQKNMMLTEGVGRMLAPEVNMWQVVEPLIGDWAKKNFGIKAKIKENAEDGLSLIATLPSIIRKTEAALSRISEGGVKLHSETLATMRQQRMRSKDQLLWFGLGMFFAWSASELMR